MKKIILTSLLALGSTSLFAALSPYNQRALEFKRVLNNPHVQKQFRPDHQLKSIVRHSNNLFVLKTEARRSGRYNVSRCTLSVVVDYSAPRTGGRMGPKPFRLIPGHSVCS